MLYNSRSTRFIVLSRFIKKMKYANCNLIDYEIYSQFKSIEIVYEVLPEFDNKVFLLKKNLPNNYSRAHWLEKNGYEVKLHHYKNDLLSINLILVKSNLHITLSSLIHLHFV